MDGADRGPRSHDPSSGRSGICHLQWWQHGRRPWSAARSTACTSRRPTRRAPSTRRTPTHGTASPSGPMRRGGTPQRVRRRGDGDLRAASGRRVRGLLPRPDRRRTTPARRWRSTSGTRATPAPLSASLKILAPTTRAPTSPRAFSWTATRGRPTPRCRQLQQPGGHECDVGHDQHRRQLARSTGAG